MEYWITPTLLGQLDWYETCPQSWKQKALADMQSTLHRVPFQPSIAVQKGIAFEQAVQRVVENNHILPEHSENFKKAAALCSGGRFQTWCDYYDEIEGVKTKLYGKRDVVLNDLIIDLKTTANYKGSAHYTSGWQPAVYGVASKIPNFRFIVAEWATDYKIKEIHIVDMHNLNLETKKQEVANRAQEYITFLRKVNLYDAYVHIYCKNKTR